MIQKQERTRAVMALRYWHRDNVSPLRIKPTCSRSLLCARFHQPIEHTPARQNRLHYRLYVITSGSIQWPGTTVQKQDAQTTVLERHRQRAARDARSDNGNIKMSRGHSHVLLSG